MIITEKLTINWKDFVKTYSDKGRMIERDGVRYSEAIDPAGLGRIYIECEEEEDMTDEEALSILMGGE